jgi:hypothetical protein
MPTEKQLQNLTPFKKGESGNPLGRPVGVKNRGVIARQWLEASQSAKNPITNEQQMLTQEDIITLALVKKARDGDVAAYKALMDSSYGLPTQSIEQNISIEKPIFNGIELDVPENYSSE